MALGIEKHVEDDLTLLRALEMVVLEVSREGIMLDVVCHERELSSSTKIPRRARCVPFARGQGAKAQASLTCGKLSHATKSRGSPASLGHPHRHRA
jgi:hypothetical protein